MVDPKRAPGIGSLAMSLFPSGRCEYTGSLISLGQLLHQARVGSSPMTLQMLPEYWDWEMYLTE